jgi:hypothetical protein
MEAAMKALAIIALALALEAGFLFQIALPGPGPSSAAPARMARSAGPHSRPLAARAGPLGGEARCAP